MSDPATNDRRRQGAMERHVQTLLLSIATASILALAAFTWQAAGTFARLDERLSTMGNDLSKATKAIEQLANTAETKTDHARDMTYAHERLGDHEQRIRHIEAQ